MLRDRISSLVALTSLLLGAVTAPAFAAPETGVGTLTIPDTGSSPILSWSWGISNDVTIGGGGSGGGKAEPKDFILTKRINPLSVELFRAAAIGSHFDDVVVSVPVNGPLSPFAIEYAMREVVVKSVDQKGAGAESVESVDLVYGVIQITVGASKFGWANPG